MNAIMAWRRKITFQFFFYLPHLISEQSACDKMPANLDAILGWMDFEMRTKLYDFCFRSLLLHSFNSLQCCCVFLINSLNFYFIRFVWFISSVFCVYFSASFSELAFLKSLDFISFHVVLFSLFIQKRTWLYWLSIYQFQPTFII